MLNKVGSEGIKRPFITGPQLISHSMVKAESFSSKIKNKTSTSSVTAIRQENEIKAIQIGKV